MKFEIVSDYSEQRILSASDAETQHIINQISYIWYSDECGRVMVFNPRTDQFYDVFEVIDNLAKGRTSGNPEPIFSSVSEAIEDKIKNGYKVYASDHFKELLEAMMREVQ